jgi:hypothetical protein
MLTLHHDQLRFAFPAVHPQAGCTIAFQRTLRVPDDGHVYPLPPGLGKFPLRLVDDYQERLPATWRPHGGVFLPMYQSEALWVHFDDLSAPLRDDFPYPCAIKVASGKINAISGQPWRDGLSADPQDYVVSDYQDWLDGFNVGQGLIRQFVAMPLGAGYTVEEQLTQVAEHGGLQLAVYPMKLAVFQEREAKWKRQMASFGGKKPRIQYGIAAEVGLANGGLLRQSIRKDYYGLAVWDQDQVVRCFVHLLNSAQFLGVTGEPYPQRPFSAQDYAQRGLPWFHAYSEGEALTGAETLAQLPSLATLTQAKTGLPLPDNRPLGPLNVITLGETPVRQEPF